MTVGIFKNGGEEDPLGIRLPHSDHILSESDRILSDTSHIENGVVFFAPKTVSVH